MARGVGHGACRPLASSARQHVLLLLCFPAQPPPLPPRSAAVLEVSESDGSGDGCVQRRWRMPAASLEEIYERALLAMAQRVGHVGTLSGGRSVPEVARAMAAGMQEAITRIVHESADEGEAEISADTAHRVLAQIAAERGLPPPRPPPGTQPPQPPAREP